MAKFLNYKSGFTLIETMVAVGIFVLSMGVVVSFIIMAYRSQNYVFEQAAAISEARRGIESMVKELREAKMGDDGSYVIEKAEDYEIIFYSDIDKDGDTERVRYFIYESHSLSDDCVTFANGGSCGVNFPNFSVETIDSAELEVCVEGDLNGGNEKVEVFTEGVDLLGTLCQVGCDQCFNNWEGCTVFDVTGQAADGSISFTTDGSPQVTAFCDWQEANHSLKAKFDFSWTETLGGQNISLKRGLINPVGDPIDYPEAQEEIVDLSQYVRNILPLFRYFDGDGNELPAPARLEETKLIKVYLVININPNRAPQNFELESSVQIRNLKDNL